MFLWMVVGVGVCDVVIVEELVYNVFCIEFFCEIKDVILMFV